MTMEVGARVEGGRAHYVKVKARNVEQAIKRAERKLKAQGVTAYTIVSIAY